MVFAERLCLKMILYGCCLLLIACGTAPDGASGGETATSAGTDPDDDGTTTPPPTPPSPPNPSNVIEVSNAVQFRTAVANANPGDTIVLNNGSYIFSSQVNFNRAGTSSQPITVKAKNAGQVILQSNTVELFNVSKSDWRFEDLVFEGVCSSHDDCEHAFHIVGGAHRTQVKNSTLRNFNAMIKGNGENNVFPDDVLITGNDFYNSTGRNTSNPVTFIDVVGGGRWIVRGNKLSDFFKNGGDGISYAAFLKGNSYDGVFENNLVICSKNHSGGTRLGLSFGGGGTGAAYCQFGSCATEHRNGTLRNNIIMNCDDVGIYLNKAQGTKIYNNTLYNTNGIDVRFSTSSADIRNNIVDSGIRNRDGGTSTSSSNLSGLSNSQIESFFVNPAAGDFALKNGATLVDKGENLLSKDHCDVTRNSPSDIGAIEYNAGTTCPNFVLQNF